MSETENDFLDGICEPDDERAALTADDEVDALALFADTDFLDPAAVEDRAAEWRALFPEPES